MKGFFHKPLQTLLAGFLAVLPLALTVAAVIWVGRLVHNAAGPQSAFGRLLISIGITFVSSDLVAYLIGFVSVVLAMFLLGLVVQSGLKSRFKNLTDRVLHRVPLIGSIYDLTNRFVGIFDRQEQADLKKMSPVWCFLGGEGGTAVLALLSTPAPVVFDGRPYHAVLVPTAPVPFGGGLLYVPAEWVKPADFGVEKLTSIYVSMGLTSPQADSGKMPVPGH
ncbi:MAG: DUF502 domain-containing protein [Deltaproteobacteria bacterium]|jgi:uncharacterized membrane protein